METKEAIANRALREFIACLGQERLLGTSLVLPSCTRASQCHQCLRHLYLTRICHYWRSDLDRRLPTS